MIEINSVKSRIEQLHERLFNEQEAQVYVILDGASIPNLLSSLEENEAEYVCLYRGELEPELAETAPYLVLLKPRISLTTWVLSGFGKHWGIFAVSKSDIKEMRRHFRKYLMIYNPDGKPLYFRYYDPRVLRIYLPTCNKEETQTVFGPVTAFFVEKEDAEGLVRYTQSEGKLGTQKIIIPNT